MQNIFRKHDFLTKIHLIENLSLELLSQKLKSLLLIKTIPKQSKAFIIEKDNKIVGILIFIVVPPEIEILDFAIITSFQQQHLGSKLLNELIHYAKMNNFSSIFLEVNEKNQIAQHLYKKNDFIETGKRKKYYNGKDDAIIMKKVISC